METKQLGIGFGALMPTIAQQLRKQGYKYDADKVKYFEVLRTSMTHLMFSSLLTDSEMEKVRRKLFKQIEQHVVRKNKLKKIK